MKNSGWDVAVRYASINQNQTALPHGSRCLLCSVVRIYGKAIPQFHRNASMFPLLITVLRTPYV